MTEFKTAKAAFGAARAFVESQRAGAASSHSTAQASAATAAASARPRVKPMVPALSATARQPARLQRSGQKAGNGQLPATLATASAAMTAR